MTQRLMLSAAAALALAMAPPAAAKPEFSGVYKAIPESIYFSDAPAPKDFSLTIDIRITKDRIRYTSTNDTRKDAPPAVQSWEAPLDGTPAPLPNQARFDQVSVTRLSPFEYRVMKMKGGDVISGEFWTFAKDGRKFVRRGVGKNPAGKSHVYDEWFAKVRR